MGAAAASPAPICANAAPPAWVTSTSHPDDGTPDPTGRIVFGALIRIDVVAQLVSLYAVDPDGSDLVQLLDCETERPRFSHDGSQLAIGITMDDGSHQVATMNVDGSEFRILTDTAGYAILPDWSPDDSWMIYSFEPMPCPDDDCIPPGGFHLSLWRMDADGTDQRLLGDPDRADGSAPGMPDVTQDAEARLSPDGSEVVFNRIDGPDFVYHLMIRDLATGVERMATGSDRGEEHPEWSPDGKWIIYNTYDETDPNAVIQHIERLPADDPSAEPVVLYSGIGYKPTYSPDGSRIAFFCEGRLCTMDADGSNVQVRVVAPGIELNHVAWGVAQAG